MNLSIERVTFAYSSTPVLDNTSITLDGGTITGIVGPNGSGKTTLLRCINGTLKPSKGVVLLDGDAVATLARRDIARKMAVVPQQSPPAFSFSALDIVLMGREAYLGQTQREGARDVDIALAAMSKVGVLHLANRTTAEMSGGEMQRVIVARALAQQPRVLLLDEPTLHLDIARQLDVLELVRDLAHTHGLAVILVCHDLNLVARYCDRVIVLNRGRIVAAGPPRVVFTRETIAAAYEVDAEVQFVPSLNAVQVLFLQSGRRGGDGDVEIPAERSYQHATTQA